MEFVLFNSGNQKFALPLSNIERVIPIIGITKIPELPSFVPGIINFHSEFIPVVDMQALIGRNKREVNLLDHLIIIQTQHLKLALWTERVIQTFSVEQNDISSSACLAFEHQYVNGLVRREDGTILISDPDGFFKAEEMEHMGQLLSEMNQLTVE